MLIPFKKLTPEQREARDKKNRLRTIRMRNLAPPWEKGRKKTGGRQKGSGSILNFLKTRLQGPPLKRKEYETLADELAGRLLRLANNKGNGQIAALQTLIDKCESPAITRDEMQKEIERVYSIVTRYISNEETLAAIARDLNLNFETPEA